ncbi:hypothetical protein C9383_01520 [Pseudomonas palleroniana]|nr:hypothetical protein C9383_01520 [Pseudomonas palleroniana]
MQWGGHVGPDSLANRRKNAAFILDKRGVLRFFASGLASTGWRVRPPGSCCGSVQPGRGSVAGCPVLAQW